MSSQKGQAIYAEKIRPSLTEADKGKYNHRPHGKLTNGLIADTLEELYERRDATFSVGQSLFTFRVDMTLPLRFAQV